VYKLAKLESKYNMREYININHIRPLKEKSQIKNPGFLLGCSPWNFSCSFELRRESSVFWRLTLLRKLNSHLFNYQRVHCSTPAFFSPAQSSFFFCGKMFTRCANSLDHFNNNNITACAASPKCWLPSVEKPEDAVRYTRMRNL